MKRLFSLLSLVLAATMKNGDAAAEGTVLLVPAADSALQLAIDLPNTGPLDLTKTWRLVESIERGEAVPADIGASLTPDGLPTKIGQRLVAAIPAATTAASRVRRFQLVEAQEPSRGETAFRFLEVDEKSLRLAEGQRPVFVYNHGVLSKPGVPPDRNRSTYLHPIYGLDGEVLTDDFPKDHYHHRGLFWGWPHVRLGATNYDLWDLRGIQQRFERWLDRRTGEAAAILGVENGWYIGERKVMQERARFTLYHASDAGQALDVDLIWIPVDQPISLAGAEGKSYGGLTLRFAPRTGTVITTPLGNKPEDLAMTRLPWADLSAQFDGAAKPSGTSVLVSPEHPDYPPTWLTRHYGALCVGWPGVTPATFPPGQATRCRYRIWIHRGSPSQADLAKVYRAYESLSQVRWEN